MLESEDSRLETSILKSELANFNNHIYPKYAQCDNTGFLQILKDDFLKLLKKAQQKGSGMILNDENNEEEVNKCEASLGKMSSRTAFAYEYASLIENLDVESFKTVKIPFEKTIYCVLTNSDSIIKIMKMVSNIIEFISKKEGPSAGLGEDKNLSGLELYKLRQAASQEVGYEMFVKETEYKEEKHEQQYKDTTTKIGKYDAKNKYIIEKFYNPFVEKMNYKLKLNENIGQIKKVTRENAKTNFVLKKKKLEIDKISNETILYNNPSK